MSQLRTDTLSDRAGTNSPAVVAGEFSRARFNLNGTGTIAERDSFGVASYTDNGTGDYTATWSVAQPNANYSTVIEPVGDGSVAGLFSRFATSAPVTGSFRTLATVSAGTATDVPYLMVALLGDRV